MASTQDLKRRVRSISNTRKLTRAMELVASARLRRAQQRIEAMRPYADRMSVDGGNCEGGCSGTLRCSRRENANASRSSRSRPCRRVQRAAAAPSRCAARRRRARRCASTPPASGASRPRGLGSSSSSQYLDRVQRQAGLPRCATDRPCRVGRGRLARSTGRPRDLQRVPFSTARPAGDGERALADSNRGSRRRGRRAGPGGGASGRLLLRARAAPDPRPPAPGLRASRLPHRARPPPPSRRG